MTDFQRRPRNPYADAVGGKPPERMSTFFDFKGEGGDEKGKRKVTRVELLAVLTQIEKGKKYNVWWRRLGRFLMAPSRSGPVHAVPLTKGEIARGEGQVPENE